MVNIAFPYKENDASTMELALMVLQSMADKGYKYIRACHTLLTKIRATIKPRGMASPIQPPQHGQQHSRHPTHGSNGNMEDIHRPAQILHQLQNDATLSESSTFAASSVPVHDAAFGLEAEGDPGLWAEVLGSIGIDMDRQWVESALMREQQMEAINDVL
jgi:proline utilization trans-activator